MAHPEPAREVEIIRLRAPEVSETLARQVAAATAAVRDLGLYKPPGVAETIDWARALTLLGDDSLVESHVRATLGALVKYREDQDRVLDHDLDSIVSAARTAAIA